MARFTLTEDFPTPPFPELTAITRVVGDTWVGSARSRAFSLALDIRSARWRLVMAVVLTTTSSTPGKESALRRVSPSIWPRRGHSAIVRANPMVTVPSGAASTEATIPKLTMLSPSSGSITPRKAAHTCSATGAVGLSDTD